MFLYLDFTKDSLIGFEVDKHFYTKKINNNKKTSERINQLISQKLNKLNKDYVDIKKIYILLGPGSFTGVRTAISFSKSLKLIHKKIEIFGISKFRLIANLFADKIKETKCNFFLHNHGSKYFLHKSKNGVFIKNPELIDLDNHEFKFLFSNRFVYDNIKILENVPRNQITYFQEKAIFYSYNFDDFIKISKKMKKSDEIIRPVYIKDFYNR